MLEVKVERCAGIDVGKKFLLVCVLIGLANQKPTEEVRRFGTNVKCNAPRSSASIVSP
jgi:transposase